jgi:hypothetical protein
MQHAILKTLKDANGTYPFPGGTIKKVDLFCNGQPNSFHPVIVNNALAEFSTVQAGRIAAIKIVSACGTYNTYVVATENDVQSLQNCCNDKISLPITVGCTPVSGQALSVLDVFGTSLGNATTPAQYVALWNGSVNNQLIGKLYEGSGWNFILEAFVGSYKPLHVGCNA